MFENGNFMEININDILPNRFQPRIYFNEKELNKLAQSIYEHGVIQPIIVREVNNKYEIIAGERRYKASKLANKATIPAIVVNLSDRDSEEIALLENIQRQDLTPIEEAVSYKRILDMGYITQEELAKKIGKSQPTIANKIRLLNLDDTVQEALLYGKISERHARSLLKLTNREIQRKMLDRIINERLTVRKTDQEIAKELKEQPKATEQTQPEQNSKILNISDNAETLFDELETISQESRKEGFMDIDKIMREAKDINADSEPNDISKLMNHPATTPGQENVQNPTDINPQTVPMTTSQPMINNDNKFVHYVPTEEPVATPSPEPQASPDVNFNSIFKSTPADLMPANQPVTQTEQAPVNPSPTVSPQVPDTESNANADIASAVSAAFEAVANSQNVSQVPENSNQISAEAPLPANNLVAEVSSGTPSVVPTLEVPVPESPINSSPKTLMPETPPQTAPVQNPASINATPEPAVTTANLPVNDQSLTASMPNSVETSSMANVAINNPVSNPNPTENVDTNLDNPAISLEIPIQPAVTSEVTQNNNIPTGEIIETTNQSDEQEIQPSMMATPIKAVNNNFSNIIHLIRECAGQIESLGYNINLDEVDLNDNYQVTFTINK